MTLRRSPRHSRSPAVSAEGGSVAAPLNVSSGEQNLVSAAAPQNVSQSPPPPASAAGHSVASDELLSYESEERAAARFEEYNRHYGSSPMDVTPEENGQAPLAVPAVSFPAVSGPTASAPAPPVTTAPGTPTSAPMATQNNFDEILAHMRNMEQTLQSGARATREAVDAVRDTMGHRFAKVGDQMAALMDRVIRVEGNRVTPTYADVVRTSLGTARNPAVNFQAVPASGQAVPASRVISSGSRAVPREGPSSLFDFPNWELSDNPVNLPTRPAVARLSPLASMQVPPSPLATSPPGCSALFCYCYAPVLNAGIVPGC